MTLLGALTRFAEALELTLGPVFSEILGLALLAGLGWWRARTAINTAVGKVEAKADAGIAQANASATTAKAEARDAKLQLAEIKGSLRPAAIATPESGTSISGHYEPVRITETKPRASLTDPELSGFDPLPKPSGVPDFEVKTRPDTPSARRT